MRRAAETEIAKEGSRERERERRREQSGTK
jgi:hypothetical protein